MHKISIIRPDDWHVHFRDAEFLFNTVPATARYFARALAMPNLIPPLTDLESILAYRNRIIGAVRGYNFTPYMTFYLTNKLQNLEKHPFVLGGKLYPFGITTNAEAGIKKVRDLYPVFSQMQDLDLVLQIHGESLEGDIFLREARFLTESLQDIVASFPRLRIVLEHISTAAAVEFVENAPNTLAATVTPHHLLFNRNKLLSGGLHPHYYCMPILKKESDRKALSRAVLSGNPKFFAGTDSAPHAKPNKESACPCAGIYSAPIAIALYAEFFSQAKKLDALENFLSRFGAEFYKLPINTSKIEIVKNKQIIPQTYPFGTEEVVPIMAGQELQWSVYED